MHDRRWGADGMMRDGAPPDETFPCPFCGGRARIASFCLDGDELFQALCDNCGTPSYFSDSKSGAMNAWAKQKP